MKQHFHNKNNENKKCTAGEMTKVSDSSNVNLTERIRKLEILFYNRRGLSIRDSIRRSAYIY